MDLYYFFTKLLENTTSRIWGNLCMNEYFNVKEELLLKAQINERILSFFRRYFKIFNIRKNNILIKGIKLFS